jgi:HSP20 family protein
MAKWEPFKDLTSIRENLNKVLEESIIKMVQRKSAVGGSWNPPVDIYELEGEFILTIELPGMKQKDITLEMKDNVLSLKGERKLSKNLKEENFQRMEPLPSSVNVDIIKAAYKQGILTITLPKKKVIEKKNIKVSIS